MMLPVSLWEKLDFGLRSKLLVREEFVELGLNRKLLYVSDLHLSARNHRQVSREVLEALGHVRPDLLLLGGDLLDHRTAAVALQQIVSAGLEHGRVGAVSGNHDFMVGRKFLKCTVQSAGGLWLEDEPIRYDDFEVLGRIHQKSDKTAILCSHYPTDFPKAQRQGIALVLAGHLHGWQIVFARRGEYLYPGAWLSRWNGTRFDRPDATLIVSRGVTDLFPLRWNCPREIVLIYC